MLIGSSLPPDCADWLGYERCCDWMSLGNSYIAKCCVEETGRSVVVGVTRRINSKLSRSVFSLIQTYWDPIRLKGRSDIMVENGTDF